MKLHIILGGLSENLLAPPLFLLLIFSIIFLLLKRKYKNSLILMLLCGLVVPIIIALVIPHHKQQVYMVPLIPTIVLLIAASVSYLNIKLRRILLALFIAVSLLQYTELSYGYKTWFCDWKIKINDHLSFKYFDKYDEDIVFYNTEKRDRYIQLLKRFDFTKNKKILILAENNENIPFVLHTLRAFILYNGFKNIVVDNFVLNLYLPNYAKDLMNYDLIIDLRTCADFNYEYHGISNDINSHKYINNFYIPKMNEFFNKYNSFWSMYYKTNDINISIEGASIYKLKDDVI